MLALPNSFFKMARTEARWRGQNDYVGQRDGLLVGIQTNKLALFRQVGFLSSIRPACQRLIGQIDPVLKGIGNGYNLDVLLGIEGLHGGTPSPASAANQGYFDGVVNRRVGTETGHGRQVQRKLGKQRTAC